MTNPLLPNMQAPRFSPSTSPYFVTEKNLEALKTKLQDCSLEFIDEKDDLDSNFDKFYSKVKDCFIDYCTRRPSYQPRRKNQPFNPWMTEGLPTSSSRKLYLWKRYKSSSTARHLQEFKTYKNLFKSLIRRAKSSYYALKFR